MMSWAVGIIGALAVVIVLFAVLQRLSDKTYRPSASQVRDIILASIEGRLDLGSFDEFSCVRIAYDRRLDQIRRRYNAIVEDSAYSEGEITKTNATPLNAEGKSKLQELLRELEHIAAQQFTPADATTRRG